MINKYFLSQENIKDKYFWIFVTYIVSCVGFFAPAIFTWNEKISNFKRVIGVSTIANHDISKVISNYYIYLVSLGDTIVCDELVKAIEGVTTNGKTKLQQG